MSDNDREFDTSSEENELSDEENELSDEENELSDEENELSDEENELSDEENELSDEENELCDELTDELKSIFEDSDIGRDDELKNVTGRGRISVGGVTVDVALAGQNLHVNLVADNRNINVNLAVDEQNNDVNVVVNGRNIIVNGVVMNQNDKDLDLDDQNVLKTSLEPISGAGLTTGGTTTDGKSQSTDEIENSRPNSDRESSDATPSKVPRTGNVENVTGRGRISVGGVIVDVVLAGQNLDVNLVADNRNINVNLAVDEQNNDVNVVVNGRNIIVNGVVMNQNDKDLDLDDQNVLKTSLEPISGEGFTTGGTTTDGKSQSADEIVNSRPNSDRESSDATPSKVPRTGNAKDVSEFTSDEKSEEFQRVIEEEINSNACDELVEENICSASEDKAEEEKPSLDEPGPDDLNDPDYTKDMDIH